MEARDAGNFSGEANRQQERRGVRAVADSVSRLMLATEKTMSTTSWFENAGRTKGGEALAGAAVESWYVLWTYSNSEQLVHNQLAAKGFQLFLPTIEAWSRRGGIRRLARVPMFSGYVFLRHAMDKASYIEICQARGLVRVLGERW